MNQIQSVSQQNENNSQSSETNRFSYCEEIVDALVEQGLPNIYNPSVYISKIAKNYSISQQEAKTCLKLAMKQIEAASAQQNGNEAQEEELNAQSGYFYPTGYTTNSTKKSDGMDSLSSLGSYNRLMFGIK